MKKISPARFRQVAFILAIVIFSLSIGYRAGRSVEIKINPQGSQKLLINRNFPSSGEVDFSLFWTVWDKLQDKYFDKSHLNAEKMVNGAISGMVNALGDPYTVYLPPKENDDFKQDLSGSFEGIGAQLGSKDDKIIVQSPLNDHPAQKAGIKAGDWIVKVNNEETIGWTVPQAVTKIRGPKGSTVTLTIIHENETKPIDIAVKRDQIIVKSVEYSLEKKPSCKNEANCPQVILVKLSRFGDKTNDEWNQMVTEIRQKGLLNSTKGLVLDLRNNPGGYLQSSIHIASEFIKQGVVVIQENSDGSRQTYSVSRVGSILDTPMVVLVNKGSASAAEILSGALNDHKRAVLVGEKTFGKGSIQTPEDLAGGAGIHITTGKWILPNGDWIHGKGIIPEIEVKNPEDASNSADLQLNRAIDELAK